MVRLQKKVMELEEKLAAMEQVGARLWCDGVWCGA